MKKVDIRTEDRMLVIKNVKTDVFNLSTKIISNL